MSLSPEWTAMGIGYTLASGHLFTDFAAFQHFAEDLLNRPVMTHEFADKELWNEMRSRFEVGVKDALADTPGKGQ
jgi:hypothetical protein